MHVINIVVFCLHIGPSKRFGQDPKRQWPAFTKMTGRASAANVGILICPLYSDIAFSLLYSNHGKSDARKPFGTKILSYYRNSIVSIFMLRL